jgi:hypothetical protein
MEISRGAEMVYESPGSLEKKPLKPQVFAPSLFRHEALIKVLDTARELDQTDLTNMLNHTHFTDGFVNVLMRHPQYKETIMLRAFPGPCMGNRVTCTWADDTSSGLDLQKLEFLYLVIDDGRSMIMVPGILSEITGAHVVVELPEKSFALRERRARRYVCNGIEAELLQNGFHAKGELLDFSPMGFRMKLRPEPSCSFRWFNPEESAMVQLKRDGKLLFSGACRFVRQERGTAEREIVLSPSDGEIRRYKKKACRNLRQQLNPAPRMVFTHPFLGRREDLEISDISTSGFSVCEEEDERLLLPGIILPEVTINFAGFLKMNCSAQVIYSKPADGKGYRCGSGHP